MDFYKVDIKPTQSQMSLDVSDIVLKNKFAIKRYETVLYTCSALMIFLYKNSTHFK